MTNVVNFAFRTCSSRCNDVRSGLYASPRAPPIAPADLNMAMHQDGGRSKSSSLLRQILQPLPEATSKETGIDAATVETGQENEGGGRSDRNDGPNNDAVAESVVSIVDSMGLDETEAVALRLAIANGDDNIKGALELFRLVA